MTTAAHDQLAPSIRDPAWGRWAAHLTPAVTIAAVLAWLDADQPDPQNAAARIRQTIRGITAAASSQPATPRPR